MADPMEILCQLRNENPTLSKAEIFELWMAAVQEDESALEAMYRMTFDDMLAFDPERAKRLIEKGDANGLADLLKDMTRH